MFALKKDDSLLVGICDRINKEIGSSNKKVESRRSNQSRSDQIRADQLRSDQIGSSL